MSIHLTAAELEKVIAHRGASYDAPENTCAAIGLAIEFGAKIIEFDVRETKDGELFLFHDAELKRLCGRKGIFEELESETAAQLDVGSWFSKNKCPDEKPPLLTAAIQQCLEGGAVPLIEHKTGSPDAYAKVLSELGAVDRVIVQSFDWEFIGEIRKILPDLRVGALGKKKLSSHKDALLKMKPNWVGWSDRDIRESDIEWLKSNGFHIAIWTVNDPKRAKYLLDCGVDKIITDRAGYMREALEKEQQ